MMKRYKSLKNRKFITRVAAGVLSVALVCTGAIWQAPLEVKAAEWSMIETDVPDWKDAITDAFGENAIAGCATTKSELGDQGVFELLQKHCNSVTFGNELKPDCLFGYSNDKVPGTKEVTFNGTDMTVPNADFSRADSMLKQIKEWNDANPDRALKIRGHVLLWHSQTPEWFFHEDYDKSKDYVDKETMNKRLEWYISMVFEHYLGEDSPYKDMFYGWDVVNEATTDNGEVYRTDTENGSDKLSDSTHGSKSSWWHVYESNEFIINAFKYANKYAPESLELYYNDYGETSPAKKERIKELIRAVKAQEGEPGVGTRISGFGMQGHYDMNNFSLADFETAAREYAEVAGAIQLTELDFKASNSFDGSDASLETEYVAQSNNYQLIFDTLKKLQAEGIKVRGITFWGTVDKYSWLQSRSDVGGGADGKSTQCPLLFNDSYKVKPAFWAFVDPTQIVPPIKKIRFTKTADGKFARKDKFTFSQGAVEVEFVPLWDESGLKIQYTVTDKEKDDNDSITFYVDEENTRGDLTSVNAVTKTRSESKASGGGYKGEVEVPLADAKTGKHIGFDIMVTDGAQKASLNDFNANQEKSSKCYAEAILQPERLEIPTGTITVDGEKDELWKTAATFPLEIAGQENVKAEAKLMWDVEKLYVLAWVTGKSDSAFPAQDGFLDVCIDEKNDKTFEFGKDDKVYRIKADGSVTATGANAKESHVTAVAKQMANGYVVEASVAWSEMTPKVHGLAGLELRLNAAEGENLILSWADNTGEALNNPSLFGTVEFGVAGEAMEEETWELTESLGEGAESADSNTDKEAGYNGTNITENSGSAGYFIVADALAMIALLGTFCAWIYMERKNKNK